MKIKAAKIEEHRGDIQALIGSGFASLRGCDYLLLQITAAAPARAWIGTLLASGCIRSLADLGGRRQEDEEGRDEVEGEHAGPPPRRAGEAPHHPEDGRAEALRVREGER